MNQLFSLLFLFLSPLLLSSSSAQTDNCASQTFSNNKLYASCTSLSELSASLHWTYHPTNGTIDVAYRIPQDSSYWVAWAINPTKPGMQGANAFLAYHDSAGSVNVITTQLSSSSYNPTIVDENLTFAVYDKSAEYLSGIYIIYASLDLPSNGTSQNTVWQAGSIFQNGLPDGHSTTGPNVESTSKLDFLSGQGSASSAGGSSSKLHRRNIHGVLNAVSWGLLMPLGIIIARYMRVFKTLDPAWFYLHITCQSTGYILGVAGWGLGLKLGSESKGITFHSHRNIGTALFVFATLQVFALLLRPLKTNKYRLYWNIYHRSVGYSVIVLSIINIFKGFNILNPENKWKHIYIAIIATLGGLALILEAITWAIVLKRRRRGDEKSHRGTNGTNVYATNGTNDYI
ncbi:hypothetical protein LUZ60_006028 [Juncus effusus]|nr:hypothetical protein LUZ60_006028 [Juncus effusus]